MCIFQHDFPGSVRGAALERVAAVRARDSSWVERRPCGALVEDDDGFVLQRDEVHERLVHLHVNAEWPLLHRRQHRVEVFHLVLPQRETRMNTGGRDKGICKVDLVNRLNTTVIGL